MFPLCDCNIDSALGLEIAGDVGHAESDKLAICLLSFKKFEDKWRHALLCANCLRWVTARKKRMSSSSARGTIALKRTNHISLDSQQVFQFYWRYDGLFGSIIEFFRLDRPFH